MKKLLFIFLGLASFNTYAADPTYDATKGALQNNSALCAYGYNRPCSSYPLVCLTPNLLILFPVTLLP